MGSSLGIVEVNGDGWPTVSNVAHLKAHRGYACGYYELKVAFLGAVRRNKLVEIVTWRLQ
jgi:hypothetical protein